MWEVLPLSMIHNDKSQFAVLWSVSSVFVNFKEQDDKESI